MPPPKDIARKGKSRSEERLAKRSFRAYRLAATALTVKALMAFGTVSMAPTTVPVPMNIAVPVRGRTPVPTCPHPMVIAPSPTSTDPDISWCRASWYGFHNGGRDWWLHNDRRGSDHNWSGRYNHRSWNWYSDVDTETKPGMRSGHSHSGQGENCDSLFHIRIRRTASP